MTNGTLVYKHDEQIEAWIDDATWILTSSFIIFTMQSGFGLLESGMSSKKNEVNIMIKNVVDVVFGTLTYWAVGYGLTFGTDKGANWFTGVGSFFLDPDEETMGTEFSKFIFQASFCTTATTIVSGAIAERTKLTAYIAFCLLNTIVYSFPAHWVWSKNGWLKQMDVVDVAGVGPVHLVGGVTALVAAIIVKPRYGRFSDDQVTVHGNSVNAVLGLFILWWGWLGFNCGSTFGISGGKWKIAARSAATTILSSCSGGVMAFLLSFLLHKRKFDVQLLVNGILGSLVSITGICAVTTTWAAILIGAVGACVTTFGQIALVKMKVDDPVGAVAVHLMGSIWGILCCGLFGLKDDIEHSFSHHDGLVWGGGFYLLGVQTMAAVTIIIWSVVTSFIVLKLIDMTIGLRLTLEEELYGADYCEHNVELPPDVKEYAESVLRRLKEKSERAKKSNGNVPRADQVNSTPDQPTDNIPARDTDDLILENINKCSDEEATDNDDKVRKKCEQKQNSRTNADGSLQKNNGLKGIDKDGKNDADIKLNTRKRARKTVVFASVNRDKKVEGGQCNPAFKE
ncbi:putative ammonium transporter 3 [Mytilus californianus]|uniref:putative ammonium transporter 3 n=1 Tax=Mytilus californianus TaxID=6549 RepID=UPI002247262C|nr:putative ammonium transporter 3 [Mytilus californianus]